jgi:hypothetical protein
MFFSDLIEWRVLTEVKSMKSVKKYPQAVPATKLDHDF